MEGLAHSRSSGGSNSHFLILRAYYRNSGCEDDYWVGNVRGIMCYYYSTYSQGELLDIYFLLFSSSFFLVSLPITEDKYGVWSTKVPSIVSNPRCPNGYQVNPGVPGLNWQARFRGFW